MKQTQISHHFVEYIPEKLEQGVLYISKRYHTAIHLCCCGCGEEVVTPLNPTDWSLRVEGNAITLYPSIGNWSLPCKSHYWLQRGMVIWAGQMTENDIERGRSINRKVKKAYFEKVNRNKSLPQKQLLVKDASRTGDIGLFESIWLTLKRWWNS